jgi:PAS domain S-box-containing protein
VPLPMKTRFTIQRLSNYFLDAYSDADYVTQQKARTLLAIILTIMLIISPSFLIVNIVRDLGPTEIIMPAAMFVASFFILHIFKRGRYKPASHMLLIMAFTVLWLSLFLGDDKGNVIIRVDTIALVLGLLTFVPLVITRRARNILIYLAANTLLLAVFVAQLRHDYAFSAFVLSEYFLDNFVAMVFISLTSYLVFTIYREALERAERAEEEVSAQNEELRASNEEFEAINEELVQSQQELIKREIALKREEERYRNIIQSIHEGYFEVDLGGRFTFVNASLEKLSGYSMDELMTMDNRNYTSDNWSRRIYDIFNNIYQSGKSEEIIDFEITTRGGEVKTLEISASLILDQSGRAIGFRGITRDVTEKKKHDEELQKIKKIESIGLLAGGIAHDFNNILTGIVGNISLAKNAIGETRGARELLDMAESASMRARELTQQLLTFSRGGAPIKKMTTITELLTDIAGFVLRGSKVGVRFDFDKDISHVAIDQGQISQVIHNLVINASQAMPDGGTITISCRNAAVKGKPHLTDGDYIAITIKDQGPGIAPENLSSIFDPYFTTKKDGTGLGLTISYSIIKNHSGHIEVESEKGNGAVFTVYLPVSDLAADEQDQSTCVEPRQQAVACRGRVLVMDDDAMVASVTAMMLVNLGYTIDLAVNGYEAIDAYKREYEKGSPYCLVIMDLTIPGSMGGREAMAFSGNTIPAYGPSFPAATPTTPSWPTIQISGSAGSSSSPTPWRTWQG